MPNGEPAQLLAVVGGESTGKSSLAGGLGVALPALVVPEFLRTWVDRTGRIPDRAEQWEVMAGHRRAEMEALAGAHSTGDAWVVSDSGTLMTAVYSIQYYDDYSLLPQALEWAATAHLVVWCQDDFPWRPDPQRDGEQARGRSQEILETIFADHADLPVLPVHGPLEARVEQVRAGLLAPPAD